MDKFRCRKPRYKDDSDYTTNAPSYYDDLARKNTLIEKLAKKIWEYEDILNASLKEVKEVLARVLNVIGEGFNEEIEILLIQWVEDGTLDHIINETLMNKKADKTELEELSRVLTERITEFENELSQQMTLFEVETTTRINRVENETNQKITKVEQDTNEKIEKSLKYMVKSLDMAQINIHGRTHANDQSFTSVQGSCFLGGSGANIDFALAFLPTDGNPNNLGVVIRGNSNSLISKTGGTVLKLYHANGMDYNPDRDSIIVAHANEQIPNSFLYNNNLTEITKNGNSVISIITPQGIPTGRRVKYYTFDKKTGKHYLGDDLGIYEVDDDFKVIKIINFDDRFINYKSWGLGQTAVVHNDVIFYLTLGAPTIAQFNIKGELEYLHQIPKFTKEGVFVGVEPQSMFFDNEDNLYLTVRTDLLNNKAGTNYTRIFKASPFTNISTDTYFTGTHNTRTVNNVFVSANPTSPIVDGTRAYPFHSLDEAVNYVISADSQKRFQVNILLMDGNHGRSDIRTNGAKLTIIGENNNSYFDGLRFFNTDVILEGIHLNEPVYDYVILANQSNITLNGVRINGRGVANGIYATNGSIITGTNLKNNAIRNVQTGIYANASLILGTRHTLGLTEINNLVETTSSGFAPFLEPKGFDGLPLGDTQ